MRVVVVDDDTAICDDDTFLEKVKPSLLLPFLATEQSLISSTNPLDTQRLSFFDHRNETCYNRIAFLVALP